MNPLLGDRRNLTMAMIMMLMMMMMTGQDRTIPLSADIKMEYQNIKHLSSQLPKMSIMKFCRDTNRPGAPSQEVRLWDQKGNEQQDFAGMVIYIK